jgi:Ca2+/Na+ antiporter
LVPALNVVSDYYNIPDDIAGATLMASGASSPELLCTLVSLFITHSSLGLGTIVGSEVFNLLIICAGSVYASKVHEDGSRYLVLDKVMVVREALFYGLSIALLYVALSETGIVVALMLTKNMTIIRYLRVALTLGCVTMFITW